MDSLIVFYLCLVNAQMKWLLYIWQKLTAYLLSCMDVKPGRWLITVCTPLALHNNCFRRIFKCCWRESTKPLQFFCKTMSISHLIDQRKMIFWHKISQSESSVLKILAYLKRNQCNALRSVPVRWNSRDKTCGIRKFFRCSHDVILFFVGYILYFSVFYVLCTRNISSLSFHVLYGFNLLKVK